MEPSRGTSPTAKPTTRRPTVNASEDSDNAVPATIISSTRAVATSTVTTRRTARPTGGPSAMYIPGITANPDASPRPMALARIVMPTITITARPQAINPAVINSLALARLAAAACRSSGVAGTRGF